MRRPLFGAIVSLGAVLSGAAAARVQDVCGPFTDVSPALCPYVFGVYALGITAGTSPTTYSPDSVMTRGQAAVFVSKGVNQAIARSSRRAALGQWWNTSPWVLRTGLGLTPLSSNPLPYLAAVVSDGRDVWVGAHNEAFRVRASDGKLLETWSTTKPARALLVAMGRILVAESDFFGDDSLSVIDPALPPGTATVVVTGLTAGSPNLAFDGARIFRSAGGESISIITPGSTSSWPVTTVDGFQSAYAMIFDGNHMWISDLGPCTLLRLDSAANVLQTVDLGSGCVPGPLVFDGSNILVPTFDGLVAVRGADGVVVARVPLPAPPYGLAFDGERVLVLCDGNFQAPDLLAVLRASDLSILLLEPFNEGFGSLLLGQVASDGLNFWLTAGTADGFSLARY